jgi:ribose transport system permease protein
MNSVNSKLRNNESNRGWKFYLAQNAQELTLFLSLIVIMIIMGVRSQAFFSFNNIISIARVSSFLGIVALGQSFVLLVGGIDLSVGSVIGFSGVFSATLLTQFGWSTPVVILVTLAFGLCVGLFNGLIITKIGVVDFIVTLASMTIVHGMIYALQKGNPVYIKNESFLLLGKGSIGKISYTVITMVILYIICHIVLTRMRFGRHIYATGGNVLAARLSGIKSDRVKIITYIMSSMMAALVGMLVAAQMSSGNGSSGDNFLFDTITAVVLGGIAMTGGAGTLIGTFIGVIIISVLTNGLAMFGMPYYYQEMIKGIILIAAVTITAYRRLHQR